MCGGEHMDELDWLVPSAILTALLAALAFVLTPIAGFDSSPDFLGSLIKWIFLSLSIGLFLAMAKWLSLMLAEDRPDFGTLIGRVRQNARSIGCIAAGMVLAGLDMIFFMRVKPLLTALAPFWADPMLADMDSWLFGRDPWRFFEGMNLDFMALTYNLYWAFAFMFTLIWLFAQPRSVGRSACIINYFALWSLFGPIGQYLFSAAGPIFFGRISLGDRFESLRANIPEITNRISDYLWTAYDTSELSFAAGISAMPSMHIAIATWIVIVFAEHRSRMTPVTIAFCLYLWAGSVALGWHYALDGLVGMIGAVAVHALCRAYVRRRQAPEISAVTAAPALS